MQTQQTANSPWSLPYPVDEEGFYVNYWPYSVNPDAHRSIARDGTVLSDTHTVWRHGPFCAPIGHARNAEEAVVLIEFDRNNHELCGTCGHWREVHEDQIPAGWIRDRDKKRYIPGVYITCDAFILAEPGAVLPDGAKPYQLTRSAA